jgi:hypothetical protein
VLGDEYYAVLTGEMSLEFTNIFADKVSMPALSDRVRVNYVIFDRDGEVTDYRNNATGFGDSLPAGSRLVISLTNPGDNTKLSLTASLVDSAITVKAFAAPALEYITLTGAGSLEFANISAAPINFPQAVNNTRRDSVVFDKSGTVTAYNANSTSRELMEPGAKKVVSVHKESETVEFFFPAEWKNRVITVTASEAPALHYVNLTEGSVIFTNISDNTWNTPQAIGNTRRDYALYGKDGKVSSYQANTTAREALEPGARKVISVHKAGDAVDFFLPAAWLDTVMTVGTLDDPALFQVGISSINVLEIKNISDQPADMPKSLDNTRRDYIIYDKDGDEVESRENQTNHGWRLEPGSRIEITTHNPDQTLFIYFPRDMYNTVFDVTTIIN